jgi:hypothetical protein
MVVEVVGSLFGIAPNTTIGDIDIPVLWILQGKVVKAGVTYWTSLAEMIVEAHL